MGPSAVHRSRSGHRSWVGRADGRLRFRQQGTSLNLSAAIVDRVCPSITTIYDANEMVASPVPSFTIDSIDVGPADLMAQLPVEAELRGVIPGPDRPDYFKAVLTRPLYYRTTLDELRGQKIDPAAADPQMIRIHPGGGVDLQVFGIVIASRMGGQQLHAGMTDFQVALAFVVDNTLMRDSMMDFSKAIYVAVAAITDCPASTIEPEATAGR